MSKEQKKIVESTSYNMINAYLGFFLGILQPFFISRMIIPEEWAYFLLSLSFISFINFTISFFPPAAQASLPYYIPHLLSQDEDKSVEIRRFIIHVFKIRMMASIMIYSMYIVIMSLMDLNLILYQIIIITSVGIFSNFIQNINNSIFYAYQRFKLVLITSIINNILYTTSLFLIFFFNLENPLILIVLASVISALIPSILSFFLVKPLLPKKKVNSLLQKTNFKKNFYKIHKSYGFNIVIIGLFSHLSALIVNLFYFNFGVITFITFMMICQNSVRVAITLSGTNQSNYYPIFSKINYDNNPDQFKNLFYQLNKYLMLILCVFTGVFYFFIEIYITVIFSGVYSSIILAVQIFLFTSFARLFLRILLIIPFSSNRLKVYVIFSFIQMIIDLTFVFIALLFNNFLILVLFSVIDTFLIVFILIYLLYKINNFKVNILRLLKPFLLFLISFFISFPIIFLINFEIFSNINLLNQLFNSGIKATIFFLVFYLTIFFSKTITKEEFKQIVKILPILKSDKIFIKKLVGFLEKFFPSEK